MKAFRYITGSCIAIAALFLAPESVWAQVNSFGNSITEFQNTTSQLWRTQAVWIGQMIFVSLATLEVVLLGVGITLGWKSKPSKDVVVHKAIVLTILFCALIFFDSFDDIIFGFIEIARIITGQPSTMNAGLIFYKGWEFFVNMLKANLYEISVWGLLSGEAFVMFRVFLNFFSGLVVFVGFFVIALQYAFITIEVILTLAVGPVFLGFLPLKVTRVYGERYLSYLISLGTKVFIFYAIIGFVTGTLNDLINDIIIGKNMDFSKTWELGFMAILSVFLLAKIPDKVATYITDNVEFSFDKLFPESD